MEEEITCPECGCEFYPEDFCDWKKALSAKEAATALLNRYTDQPSAGEVARLEERISEILVSEFGVSSGKI